MAALAPENAWASRGWESERPSGDSSRLEVWCYTPSFSYAPGEKVDVRAHTTAERFSLSVVRDGQRPEVVLEIDDIPGTVGVTPDNSYEQGCDWPIATEFEVGRSWRSGLYLLIVRAERPGEAPVEHEHFIVVRPKRTSAGSESKTALMLTTSTLLAYNDWGGANHYRGIGDDPRQPIPSPVVSTQRPIGRGMLRQAENAPRMAHKDIPGPGAVPRYATLEFARAQGYTRHYADAFWGTYERPFVVWAEAQGYGFEYLTQHDLHFESDRLEAYDALVIVGHDEYWTWEMRDAVDAFVDGGGHVCRFAGNFVWQVRLSESGDSQTCFKDPRLDPVAGDPELGDRLTTVWEFAGRPSARTMGLSGIAGVYSRYGTAAPRSSGGFTIYRPDHWAFAGTGLEYGDLLGGAPCCVAAFEVDGLDYTFVNGLPYPTDRDDPPPGLEILAMAPAVAGEVDRWDGRQPMNAPEAEARELYVAQFGEEEGRRIFNERRYGSAMIAFFERGRGSVFNAGTAEWVSGLIARDPFVEAITHNVLRRAARNGKSSS